MWLEKELNSQIASITNIAIRRTTRIGAPALPLLLLQCTDLTTLNCTVTRSKIRAKVTDGRDFRAIRVSRAERIWFSWEDVIWGSEKISFQPAVEEWHTSICRLCVVFYFRVNVYLAALSSVTLWCPSSYLTSWRPLKVHLGPNLEISLVKGDRTNKHFCHPALSELPLLYTTHWRHILIFIIY